MNITERNVLKNELANIGYSLKYIDEWQPKTTLYRHKPALNVEGEIAHDVGTKVENCPGSPDYVYRKSKMGLFVWPPSMSCECKWCSVRNTSEKKTAGAKKKSSESSSDLHATTCNECGENFETPTSAGSLSALRVHMKVHSV